MKTGRAEPQIDLEAAADALANSIVETLFVNGAGQRATRIVLLDESDPKRVRDLGGWCPEAVRDWVKRLVLEGKAF